MRLGAADGEEAVQDSLSRTLRFAGYTVFVGALNRRVSPSPWITGAFDNSSARSHSSTAQVASAS
ncbi:hypothetical protein AB0H88_34410 [Nonomuraea sp. NPDC050680]|uniref:hypothetical protein n=1 Tax=Nonomuraea sp. NPDC050680 TaxID=3154630 RepID=UPI0033FD9EC1